MVLFDKKFNRARIVYFTITNFLAYPLSNVWLNKMYFEYSSAFVQQVTEIHTNTIGCVPNKTSHETFY